MGTAYLLVKTAMLKKLAQHASMYTFGSLLVTVASLVSFPIFTRVFTVDEYGILNLVSASLMLLTGISKMGVQHSIVRFYGVAKTGKGQLTLEQYYSTAFFGMLGIATIVSAVAAVASLVIPSSWWNDPRAAGLLLLASVLVIARTVDSSLSNFLRAEERSGIYSVYNVAKKYIGLAVILFVLYFVARNLYGFYWATIVTEVGATVVLATILFRKRRYTPRAFSPALFRTMLAFGAPMIGYELAGIVLNIGDRYVIQTMLGSNALGIYSAGYNLCEYIQIIVMASIGQAIMPMYVRMWEEKGEEETRRFISQALHYYLMLALPLIAGLMTVGEDLLVLLASEKYRESGAIIPYVITGMVVDGMVVIVGAGLYIHKSTTVIAGLVAMSAVLNITLNILMIPHLGILGAAQATLISYAVLVLSVLWASSKKLPITFPYGSMIKFGCMAAIMYFVVILIHTESQITTLVLRMLAGVLSYGLLVLSFDSRAWSAILAAVGRR